MSKEQYNGMEKKKKTNRTQEAILDGGQLSYSLIILHNYQMKFKLAV